MEPTYLVSCVRFGNWRDRRRVAARGLPLAWATARRLLGERLAEAGLAASVPEVPQCFQSFLAGPFYAKIEVLPAGIDPVAFGAAPGDDTIELAEVACAG